MTRRLVAAAAILVGAASVLVPSVGSASAATPNDQGLTLVSQSPWVQSGQTFDLTVSLPANTPPTDQIQLLAYSRLTTRTGFDQALSGQVNGSVLWHFYPTPVSHLPTDLDGHVTFRIPVDTTTSGSTFPPFYASSSQGPGVFPLQMRLLDPNGKPVGDPLTSFLVYGGSPGGSGTPKLSVAMTVPLQARPTLTSGLLPGRIGARESATLGALVDVLDSHRDLPLSLAITPQVLDALAGGSAADRATLAGLTDASLNDQILPASYVHLDLAALTASGLDSEVSTQLMNGASTLSGQLHRTPSMRTWVVDGPLDGLTATALARRGANQLIVPESDLSSLPAQARQTTYGRPTSLNLKSSGHVSVLGADPDLSKLLASHASPVLVANQFLAELAMVQVERPGVTRGVAVLPPSGWAPDPTLLDTILSGLANNPLVEAVTADQLFARVPEGTSSQAPIVRSLVDPKPSSNWAQAASVRAARQRLSAFASIVPAKSSVTDQANTQLLLAESVDLQVRTRQALLDRVASTTQGVLNRIRLPGGSSITLTARNTSVPLTVLSDPSVQAHVQLRLNSSKLAFRPYTPPGNQPCSVADPTSESCNLVLTTSVTTLRVPVEARTSGVFTLSVTMWSPDGSIELDNNANTVRSTAVSWVGVVLIVVAALFLAVWWIRDARHGRRPRRLIAREHSGSDVSSPGVTPAAPSPSPSPSAPVASPSGPSGDVPPPSSSAAGPSPGPAPPPLHDDVMVERFFSTPPPRHRR